jgi:thiamine-monophosphate kinase
MFDNSDRTEIAAMGEFGLIQHLSQHFENKHAKTVKGIGDDCAVIDQGDHFSLVTTDLLLEGVHFDLSFHPLKHLGYKAISVAVSDIYAMNGMAEQVMVGLGLSNRFSLEAVEELYAGMQIACEHYGVDLVGGDTTTSRSGLVLSLTAVGRVAKDKIVYRGGAQPGDLLVVSGDMGGAYMGLQILEREKRVFMEVPSMQPDLEQYDYIVGRQLKAEARKDVVELLKMLDVKPSSMIDVSDGVASELYHMAKANGFGFHVYEEKLPIDPHTLDTALAFDLNPSIVALNGGEDYELLFTVAQSDYEKIKTMPDFTVIGYVTDVTSKNMLLTKSGNQFEIKAQGWPESQKDS